MKKLILLGCGVEAEKFLQKNSQESIKCCVDDKLDVSDFKGYKVYKSTKLPDIFVKKEDRILIFTKSVQIYNRISSNLKGQGLDEFEDYIPSCLYNKKIALIWGNCHAGYIKHFLRYSKEFKEKYEFYDTANLWDMKERDMDYNLLRHCDLFISQHIRDNNSIGKFASSEVVEKYLKKDCIVLKFPNLFGLPKFMFPQTVCDGILWHIGGGIRWYKDVFIDACKKNNPSFSYHEIAEFVEHQEIDLSYIDEKLAEFWQKVEVRESQSNIHIEDYLRLHFKDTQLFLDPEHPTKEVLGEIGNRILEYLNMKRLPEDLVIHNTYAHEVPVYPQVKNYLGFEWKDKDLKRDNCSEKFESVYMDFEEYIRQYLIAYPVTDNKVYVTGKYFVEDKSSKEFGKWHMVGEDGRWGTEGKRLRLYSIAINDNEYVKFKYKVKGNKSGWSENCMNGQVAGNTVDPEDYLVDCIIECYDEVNGIKIKLRGHFQKLGWKSYFMKNGAIGDNNDRLRLECLEIILKQG